MVVPHHSASNIIKIKLPEWGAKTLVAVGGVLALAILVFFLYSSRLTLKMIHYYGLLSENRRQEKQIEYFLNETDKLRKGVEDLESRDQELREMLGMRKRKGQVEPAPEIKDDGHSQISKTFNNLAWIKDSLKDGRESFMEVAQEANQKSLVFAKLPSTWPVSGKIRSEFGVRNHPILGGLLMHSGIDIPIWEGAPVRGTADGIVMYSGWLQGYGNTIIVDHGNGYSTVYGHNSKLISRLGEKVYKGEVVAKAGSTGLSTGTHVHYEVRFNNKPVAPNSYLDLNIQMASNYMTEQKKSDQ